MVDTSAGGSPANSGYVSEQVLEYLLTELVVYAGKSCRTDDSAAAEDGSTSGSGDATAATSSISESIRKDNSSNDAVDGRDEEGRKTVAAEMAAAKLERMGYSAGYRLTERLAQKKTWNAGGAPNVSSPNYEQEVANAVAAQQLEAVKFLCKEVWMEVFRKQIDKLQTNHRGVFVLKDLDLKWLSRFPAGAEQARVFAIRLLAFPCGLIRGCLANLGIPAVVSCDFLADGQNVSACSFNIKVK